MLLAANRVYHLLAGVSQRAQSRSVQRMSFNIAAKPTFRRPVTVHVPDGDAARTEQFIATFRVLPVDDEAKFDLETGEGSTGFLKAVIVRLDDLADANGKAVEYSDDVRDEVLRQPYVRMALARTYNTELA